MSTEDQPEIQSLSTNGPSTVQLASITFQPTVQPTSTRIPLMARPTVSSGPPTVQPTLTSGPLTVQAQPLLANSQCQPLGLSFRFCSGDVAAISKFPLLPPEITAHGSICTLVGAVLFICYVVWGIPATIRFYKHVRGRLAARRQRQLAMPQDLERNLQGARPSDGGEYSPPSRPPAFLTAYLLYRRCDIFLRYSSRTRLRPILPSPR